MAKPLRELLQGAINSRHATLKNGRSKRKDETFLRAAIGRAEVFLRGYPVADDERVVRYCRSNEDDTRMIVPGRNKATIAKLLGQ